MDLLREYLGNEAERGVGAELGFAKPGLKSLRADFPSLIFPLVPNSCLTDRIRTPGLIQPKGKAGERNVPHFQSF